jgi:hypothetical protein
MSTLAANNQKRQKRLVIGGAVLLVPLLFVQVPRTLSMLRGSEPTAAPASAPAASQAAAEQSAPAPRAVRRPARAVGRNPFRARSGGEQASSSIAPGAIGFRLVGTVARPLPQEVPAAADDRFTVVLQSIPLRNGRLAAMRAAGDYSRQGLRGVGVLVSTRYGSLREGYYVVYAGRFRTHAAADRVVEAARSAGAPAPYVRPLRR